MSSSKFNPPPAEAQAVAWQFQDREGKWHGFMDERHRQNTIADGSWPVRALYTAPPSAPVGVDRNWREDASHENGDYECECVTCGSRFFGHKRRVVCRACAKPSAPVGVEGFGSRAVAEELLRCFESWEPGVRVLGNVQAKDAADLMRRILAQQPAAVDGWRLVVHQSEGDTKPAVWATDGDSFVWVADLAASREARNGSV